MPGRVSALDSPGLAQAANTAEAHHEAAGDGPAPPGQFVSDEHEADCLRFLEEVKEFVRRRSEAGLGRER